MRPGEVVAIIPARGGSKRIPRKNLREFRGLPLIAHSIQDALLSKHVTRTVVTTDDPEIESVSQQYGAEVVRRPAPLASDTATSEAAILHALDELRTKDRYEPELVVFLQCTSPARDPDDIDSAIAVLRSTGADSVMSACRFDKYIWAVDQGSPRPLNYDYRNRWRDQDFPPQYMENGSIYVSRLHILQSQKNRLGGKIAIFEMPQEKSFQIDHEHDFATYDSSPAFRYP